METKQYSSQLRLSRSWHGVRKYERIKKHKEEEVVCEKEDEISSEAAATNRKGIRLFKFTRRRSRSRTRRKVRIRFVWAMGRRPRWASLVSHLKVSWRRFAKLVKESQPYFADLFAGTDLFLHVTPPAPNYWYNHVKGGGSRNIGGLSSGHPLYMLYTM